VHNYLANNDALQDKPIDRLRRMNPLAIELYRMHKHDIATDPLPFNVNNQHMNGGVEVDSWAQSSLLGCYAIGEVAGTHGVTRPGGAALNAGQVFAMRCAQHIAAQASPGQDSGMSGLQKQIAATINEISRAQSNEDGIDTHDIEIQVQARMSDHAGYICRADDIPTALDEARALNRAIDSQGIRIDSESKVSAYFNWKHTALASEAVLTALSHYAGNGGGSRGARAMCSAQGTAIPSAHKADLETYRFVEEQDQDKNSKIILQYAGGDFDIHERELRGMEDPQTIFFEKNWADYLSGNIYKDGYRHE